MRSFTPKELISILLGHSFVFSRSNGSHHLFINRQTGKRTIVPMHSKDLKKGTLHAILKQSGIDPADLP
jgi:predicted RNA binding protein YcfA (HicA-like mRNA interferase family)